MWRALENVTIATASGSRLFVAIYNDGGRVSRRWRKRKQHYNRLPGVLRLPYACAVFAPVELALLGLFAVRGNVRGYFSLWRNYKSSRGMSRQHDMIDWIGGYPYEFASIDQLLMFFRRTGFGVTKVVPNSGIGNHQIVLERA
jgi:2-polyprenyl-6-hydroxyphenyl methylase/3-demethylubiquinone-9 3-methyltransferase